MLEMIKRAGVFLVIAETIYQFVQENRYARYVRLLIRIMTVALLAVPVFEMLKVGSSEHFYAYLSEFEAEYEAFLTRESNAAGFNGGYGNDVLLSAVTGETIEEIRFFCEDYARDYGYRIGEISLQEGLLSMVLIPESQEDGGSAAEMKSGSRNTAAGADASNAEEHRMARLFAGLLGISERSIEVRIDG